jgi:hypothetical protein
MNYKVFYSVLNKLNIKVEKEESFRTRDSALKRFEELREDEKASCIQYHEQVAMNI